MKIQGKLLALFGSIVLIGVLITGWTVVAINNLDQLAVTLSEAQFELSETLKAKNTVKQMEISELSYVLSEDPRYIHEHEQYLADFELYLRNATIRAEEASVSSVLFEITREKDSYVLHIEEVVEAAEAGEWEQAADIGEESAGTLELIDTELSAIGEELAAEINVLVVESNRQLFTSSVMGAVALVVFLLVATGAAVVVNRQVSQPLLRLMAAADAIEAGTFKPEILDGLTERTDEVGHLARSFTHMATDVEQREASLQRHISTLRDKLSRL